MTDAGRPGGRARLVLLTALAMVAFAANSILTRLALAAGEIDAAGFTGLRLLAGAVALVPLAALARRGDAPGRAAVGGTWAAAAALFGYAAAFSFAYLRLGAGLGALILFGAVQLGMLGWALLRGERHSPAQWLGLSLAIAGFAYLNLPSAAAPDPLGAGLMVVAGLCWAAYSLLGRGSAAPLVDTAGNFLRCLPLALPAAAAAFLAARPASGVGIACALASGALASGLGYAVWYAALPGLARARAAIVQLTVPVLAALGGIAFLGEAPGPRLLLASLAILGGVALTILAGERRRAG